MSEDIVPNNAPQTQPFPPVLPSDLIQQARQEVYAHARKYPVKVLPNKNRRGYLNVLLTIPACVAGTWHPVEHRLTCTREELWALAKSVPDGDAGSALQWQYWRATMLIIPVDLPKRVSVRNAFRYWAAREAQLAHHCLEALLTLPEAERPPVLRTLLADASAALQRPPDPLELTAWLIEGIFGAILKGCGLKHKLTCSLDSFRNHYIHDRRHYNVLRPQTYAEQVRHLEMCHSMAALMRLPS